MNISKLISKILPYLLLILLGIFLIWFKLNDRIFFWLEPMSQKLEQKAEIPPGSNISAWMWGSADSMSTEQSASYLEFASAENINTLYLDVGKYTDILETRDKADRGQKLSSFEAKITEFIQMANARGIEVHALSGDTNWSKPIYQYIPLDLLTAVLDYNKRHPATKFSGIQFDLEFYNQKDFPANYEQSSKEFLELIDLLGNHLEDTGENSLKLGFDISYWLDGNHSQYKNISYRGNDKPVVFHILDRLNRIPNSYLVVLAYRNKAEGGNGAVSIAKSELEYARENTPGVSIIIGQETEDNEEKSITFFGSTKEIFKRELSKIFENLSYYPQFWGIAIHHLNSYMKMPD
jgi:hypothetical protein